MEAPNSLTAEYDSATSSIKLNWAHNASDFGDIEDNVEFTVLVGVDGGDMQVMTTTADISVTFSGAESGRKYTFSVIAKLGDLQSGAATTTVQIEDVVEEIPEVDEDEVETENPDGEEWNNENNENNGNGGTMVITGTMTTME